MLMILILNLALKKKVSVFKSDKIDVYMKRNSTHVFHCLNFLNIVNVLCCTQLGIVKNSKLSIKKS